MHSTATIILIGLECVAVLFVGLHNWIPLGSLNDLKAVRVEFTPVKLFFVTLSNFIPVTIGLVLSIFYLKTGHPRWVFWYLWIFWLLACAGSLKSWWIPYFSREETPHIARDRLLYKNTHAFLPDHNGVRPNTLHVIFDVITIAILITLTLLTV